MELLVDENGQMFFLKSWWSKRENDKCCCCSVASEQLFANLPYQPKERQQLNVVFTACFFCPQVNSSLKQAYVSP